MSFDLPATLLVLSFPTSLFLDGLLLRRRLDRFWHGKLPPPHSPLRLLYWTWLGFFLWMVGLLLREYAGSLRGLQRNFGAVLWWQPWMHLLPVAVGLTLLAHTLWSRGQAKRIPRDLDREEQKDAFLRLSRRSWLVLGASWCLLLGCAFFLIVCKHVSGTVEFYPPFPPGGGPPVILGKASPPMSVLGGVFSVDQVNRVEGDRLELVCTWALVARASQRASKT